MGDEVRLEENFFQWTITITSFTGRSLGVTKMSGLVHPDQHVRNATQNSLCRAVNPARLLRVLTNQGNVGATRS